MTESSYLHGFERDEQQRLIQQAAFWRARLIRPGLEYRAGERVLDIGCGVGAVLRVLAAEFPGIRLAGIDLEPRQVEYARRYLKSEGLEADVRVGNAAALPWGDGEIDHVYMMWFLEHLKDSAPVLGEALRVLRPGGTIAIAETDYTTFKILPESKDWDELDRAQYEHFRRHGDAIVGRRLGTLLKRAGFSRVRNAPLGIHSFAGAERDELREHTHYIAGFLEPAIPNLAEMGFDAAAMGRGVAHLRAIHTMQDGAFTNIVYKAMARKPGGDAG